MAGGAHPAAAADDVAAERALSPAARNAAARARATALVVASSAERALPLHVAVWDGDEAALRALLADPVRCSGGIEACDPRGNTPLLLALKLERIGCIHALLAAGASALARDREGFSAFQEAVQLPGRAGIDAHRACLRSLLAETWARAEAKLAGLCLQLEAVPDVDLEIHWQVAAQSPPQTASPAGPRSRANPGQRASPRRAGLPCRAMPRSPPPALLRSRSSRRGCRW